MKTKFKRSLLASAVALACGPALGAEYWLCAGSFSKAMPDGSTVTMWGYAQDDDSNLDNGCGTGQYSSPGPRLTVAPTDATGLTIHLTNNLTQTTSLVIPGQKATETGAMVPVKVAGRVHSFTHEVAANGGTADYIWSNLRPGSYAYQTGTHPSVQVQMGLFGAMTQDVGAGLAYTGVPYANEVMQFYSEIDPALHAAVAGGTYGTTMTSTIGYDPKWFLVNGNVFVDSGTYPPATIPGGNVNQTTLARFFNMGLRSHTMVLQGADMTVEAEDGHLVPTRHGQYSLMVAAGKTQDVTFRPTATGTLPLYERQHNLTTSTSSSVKKTGGLMSFLAVASTNTAPTLAAIAAQNATEDSPFTVTAAGSDVDLGDTLTYSLDANPTGMTIDGATGVISWTPVNADVGTPSVTVRVTDAAGAFATQAFTVTVANTNDAPTLDAIAAQNATEDSPFTVTAAGSDIDVGDTLAYSLDAAPAGMTIDANTGAISWTPVNADVGPHSVTVRVTDAAGAFATQAFSVIVANTNDAPTLAGIAAQNASVGQPFSVTAVGSDIDVGDTFSYSMSGPAWLSISPTTGVITGTPAAGDVGASNVTVTVTDAATASASQSFSLTVAANQAPGFTSTAPTATTVGVPYSYTATAIDPEGDNPITFSLISGPTGMTLTGATVNWAPVAGQEGAQSFTVRATDSVGSFSDQVNSITVAPAAVNTAPVAVSDATFLYRANVLRTVDYAGPLGVGVLANDTDAQNNPLTALLAIGPTAGTLTQTNNGLGQWTGAFTYLRNATGNVTFTYRAFDGVLASSAAIATMRTDTAPKAVADTGCTFDLSADAVTVAGSAGMGCVRTGVKQVRIRVVWNDTDANATTNIPTDGIGKMVMPDSVAITVQPNPAVGSVVNNGDGTVTINIAATNTGQNVTFSYTVADDLGMRSSVAQSTLKVVP